MGHPQSLIEDIISERTTVTTEIADDIERALGIDSQFWLNMEAGFRATLAHNELVARAGPNHACDLGEDCPTLQTYDDDEADEEESEISAGILMDEGESSLT